jgi:hypothetical protein
VVFKELDAKNLEAYKLVGSSHNRILFKELERNSKNLEAFKLISENER